MSHLDLVGHGAYLALLGGQWLVSYRHPSGFLARVLGSLTWAILGVALGLSSIVLWSLAFAIVDARAYVRWRREQLQPWTEPHEPA